MTSQQISTIEKLTQTSIKDLNEINSKYLADIPLYSNSTFKDDPFLAGLNTTENEEEIKLSIHHRMTSSSYYIINKDGEIIKEY